MQHPGWRQQQDHAAAMQNSIYTATPPTDWTPPWFLRHLYPKIPVSDANALEQTDPDQEHGDRPNRSSPAPETSPEVPTVMIAADDDDNAPAGTPEADDDGTPEADAEDDPWPGNFTPGETAISINSKYINPGKVYKSINR